MNFLWIDVETTGRYSDKHEIIQLACIPVINGVVHAAFNEYCQPTNYGAVEQGAIDAHGISIDRMRSFQMPEILIHKFIEYLAQFDTKFIIAGYNVSFDKRFLSAMFTKYNQENSFFSLFDLQIHDVYSRAQQVKKELVTANLKLATLAKYFNIQIDAHNAISDIGATIEVDRHIGILLKEEAFIPEELLTDISVSTAFPEPAQLHVHSMYGMVESVPSVDEWAQWCAHTKTPGFSVLDHGIATALSSVMAINKTDNKTGLTKYPGVTGVPGVGLYFSIDLDTERLYPFSAWAISTVGYSNLIYLASLGYEKSIEIDGIVRPRLSEDDIKANSEGLVFGTADLYGVMGNYIADGDAVYAERAFKKYIDIFGKNLLVEFIPVSIRTSFSQKRGFQQIARNELVVDGDWNKAYNKFLMTMVDKYELKCIPSSGAHFIDKSDKLVQDCITRRAYKSGRCYHESYHALTAVELYKLLKIQLGDWLTEDKFMTWISNTLDIVSAAKTIVIKHEYHLPIINIPEHIKAKTDDYNKQTYYLTVEKCIQHGRWSNDPVYVARFKKEIDVIMRNEKLNFLPYFLLYEDIAAFARSEAILQNIGRGSAGGCLLSYYLKIIHIDPIKTNLPFERFLSHARIRAGSFPDIDADFGDRTLILQYLEQKYGSGFAQICTIQKMKTKTAIKDVMAALYGTNREDPTLKAICEMIPDSPQGVDEYDFLYGHTDKEDVYHAGIIEMNEEVKNFFTMYPAVESMVKKMLGLPRGFGRHPSAFVISTLDLPRQRIPIMKMFDKAIGSYVSVTQFDASGVESSGLVKADILGVTTVKTISDCMDLIKRNTGVDYWEEDDQGVALIYRLMEDPEVYADFYRKETDSSFQFNTPLIKGYVQQFCPTSREHLSDFTALCRPGALDAPFFDTTAAQYYMDIRSGVRQLEYLHPDLESCTTNAIFCYQEDVMKFLVDIAGYTLEESDIIRAAIAKKKQDVIMSTFTRIREATRKRGWNDEQIDTICYQVQAFAKYSFNRSHSRCYAELGYITMFLKHHHRLEWWTSVLNNTNKEDKLRNFMTLLGDLVTPPSLAVPSNNFVILDGHIVAPLSVLKSIGDNAIQELVNKGPFESLAAYVQRIAHNKVNIGHFGAMIKGRAADCMMDKDIPYAEARKKLMADYLSLRKVKSKFDEALLQTDPISIFLMEKDINTCFNKSLLEVPEISTHVALVVDDLEATGRRNVPFFKPSKKGKLPVVGGIRAATSLLKNNYQGDVGLILLFESSSHRSGVSKRTGKEYTMVEAILTDGFSSLKCVWWDRKQPLRWNKNSIVFVRGVLSEGWGGMLNLTVAEMERIDK